MGTVTLTEEQVEQLKAALKSADSLVTAVISGAPGQQTAALGVARALDGFKRKPIPGLIGK